MCVASRLFKNSACMKQWNSSERETSFNTVYWIRKIKRGAFGSTHHIPISISVRVRNFSLQSATVVMATLVVIVFGLVWIHFYYIMTQQHAIDVVKRTQIHCVRLLYYMNDFRCNVSLVYFFPRLPVCQLNWPSLFSSSWSHIMGHHFSCRAIVAPYHAYVDAIQTIRALSVFQPPRHFICLLFVTRMNICGDACVRLNAHNEEKRTHIQISKNYWDCYGSNAIKIEAICRLGS